MNYQITIAEMLGKEEELIPTEIKESKGRSSFICPLCNAEVGIKNQNENIMITKKRCKNGHKINWAKNKGNWNVIELPY